MVHLTSKISDERNSLINTFLIAASFFATILVAISLLRLFDQGWTNILYVHLSGLLGVWLITLFRNKISLSIKLSFLIFLTYSLGCIGLYFYGIVSDAETLFFLSFILAASFNKARYGIILLITMILIYSGMGLLYSQGVLVYSYDIQTYQESSYSWLLHISAFAIYGGFALMIIQVMNKVIFNNLKDIEKQRSELETLNASKDKVHRVIAHDLKRPFNNLLGIMQLMSSGKSTMTEERKGKIFDKLYRDSKGVYDLLENLLIWAESETGQAQAQKSEIGVHLLVTHAIVPYLSLADQKGVRILKHLTDTITVYSDIPVLKIVLSNILNNALKFTPKEGTITLSCQECTDHVEIKFTDTGVGISDDILERIFDPFDTVTQPGTDNEKGTGLGLGVCKDLLDRIGCSIRVSSIEGKGSTFAVIIPHSKPSME
ncbi:MAG: HAMP domain-containing histidine kinase [Fibrobacterales bacterium]